MDAGVPDERLIARAQDGDLAAFNVLVERYQGPVYNLCFRLTGDRESAEDASQEAFLSAYRAIRGFAGGNVRSWLLRIAANASKDELRRRRRKDLAVSLDAMFDSEDRPVEVPDPKEGTDSLILRKEVASALQNALLQLPFDQRQAIILVDLQDMRYEEVAEQMGISTGTVKSRIHRGREKLRQIIAGSKELSAVLRRLEEQDPKK
jgi:RNA polymerase sigma-70 factor (ECF subfamily)